MNANCTMCSRRASALAPTSSSVTGQCGHGQRNRQRRAVDAAGALDVERARSQRRARATGAHERLCPALRDGDRGPDDRRLAAWCALPAPDPRPSRSEIGASMTSTPAGGSPSSLAGPNSSTRAPSPAASAAPAATSAGPRSAPLQSTAITGRTCSCRHRWPGGREPLASLPASRGRGRARDRARLASRSRGPRMCRTPGIPGAVCAGCGTADTRSARACRSCAVRDAWPCGCATAFSWGRPSSRRRLPGCGPGSRLTTDAASRACSSRSLAQRGSGVDSWWCSGPASLRSAAHTGHRPAQSSRHRIFAGIASAKASRAQPPRSSVSS